MGIPPIQKGLHFVNTDTLGVTLLHASTPTSEIRDVFACDTFALVTRSDNTIIATDGTPSGTSELITIPEEDGSIVLPFSRTMKIAGSTLHFFVQAADGVTIWESQGTSATTTPLASIPAAPSFYFESVAYDQGRIFWIFAPYGGAVGLWTANFADGTPTLVQDLGATLINVPVHANDLWFYERYDLQGKSEIWRTDATAAGTFKLMDADPGINFDGNYDIDLHPGKQRLYIEETCNADSCNYVKHYVSDGTISGTQTFELPGYDAENWHIQHVMDDGTLLVEAGDPILQTVKLFSYNRNNGQLNSLFGDRKFEYVYPLASDGDDIYLWHRGAYDANPADEVPAEFTNTLFSATTAPNSAQPVLCGSLGIAEYPVDGLYPLASGLLVQGFFFEALRRTDGDICPPALEGEENGILATDTNADFKLTISEILRLIQFYNSGGFHCANGFYATEDGYAPGSSLQTDCATHDGDNAPQDWKFTITEVLRAIQIYNSSGYTYCPEANTEDGFCPTP